MDRWLTILVFFSFTQVWAQALQQVQGQRDVTGEKVVRMEEPKAIVLNRGRYYRFDVEELYPEVSVALVKRWVFRDTFPQDLLRKVKGSPLLKQSRLSFLLNDDRKVETDSGYIRWVPDDGEGKDTGALLWHINGKSTEFVVNVDLVLDHTVGKARPPFGKSFGPLRLTVDLSQSQLLAAEYADINLPDQSTQSSSVDVENTLHVSLSGSLTDRSSKSVRSADGPLSGEITNALGSLRQLVFTNESHYGITLGWLGYEHLLHGMAFVTSESEGTIDFTYTVSGDSFPLSLVRQQLQDAGWPLVLRGTEYVGNSEEGVPIFRRVEYTLSKKGDSYRPSF